MELRDSRGLVRSGVRTTTGEWMRAELTILCITPAGDKAIPFLRAMRKNADALNAVFAVALDTKDGWGNLPNVQELAHNVIFVKSDGYVESVIKRAYSAVQTNWCLRLDDDEEMSPALFDWIRGRHYLDESAWHIPTMALYPDKERFITNEPLYPDVHIRLTSWRHYSQIAEAIHAGQPFMAAMTDKAIFHHKYLVESYQDRIAKAAHYDSIKEGAGTGTHKPFTLPEEVFEKAIVAPIGDGTAFKPTNLHTDEVEWDLT